MKKLFLVLCVTFSLFPVSYAGPYDDWPDDAVCMWLEMKPTHEGYLGEAKKRGILCEGGVSVITKTTSKVESPAKATVKTTEKIAVTSQSSKASLVKSTQIDKTSTEQILHDTCTAIDNGKVTNLNKGIKKLVIGKFNPTQYMGGPGRETHVVDLYGDGTMEVIATLFSGSTQRLSDQNIRFWSEDTSKNIDKKVGMVFNNEQPNTKEITKILSGDINGDEILDLVFVDYGEHDPQSDGNRYPDGKLVVLKSSEQGYYWSEIKLDIPKGGITTGLTEFHTGVLIDIDNDKDLDLVVGGNNYSSLRLHAYKNDGNGNFKRIQTTPDAYSIGGGWTSFTASDIDDDGYHDLVMSYVEFPSGKTGELQILWGSKEGLFNGSLNPQRIKDKYLSSWDHNELLSAFIYDKNGRKNIVASFGYEGTKIVNYTFDGRKHIDTTLITDTTPNMNRWTDLETNEDGTHFRWIDKTYPCGEDFYFFTLSEINPLQILKDNKWEYFNNKKTSYQIAKESEIDTVYRPREFDNLDISHLDPTAWVDLDGDGDEEIFVAAPRYFPRTHSVDNAPKSDFFILQRLRKGNLDQNPYDFYENNPPGKPVLLRGLGQGCIHPRKAIVNDFNLDNKMDIFVACHGYDAKPYPGELSKIILSTSDGKYLIKDTKINGFTHSAASADFNNDGAPDLILIDRDIQVWLNDGQGSFTRTNGYLPSSLNNMQGWGQVELPDIDGDGDFDLFIGGNEYYLPTKMGGPVQTNNFTNPKGNKTAFFINQGDNKFSDNSKISIPAIKGKEVITDMVVTGTPGNKIAWILRSAGGPNSYYQGTFVEKYSFVNKSSEIVYNSLNRKDIDQKRASRWHPWIISWSENGKKLVGSKFQDEFTGFAVHVDETDPLYMQPRNYEPPERRKPKKESKSEPEPEPLKVGIDKIEGDIQTNYFHLEDSQSIRHGDYVSNSTEFFLDGDSSEKFSIQPLDCDLSKSADCNNNHQRVMMTEKDIVTGEETKLYEWSMFVPESNIFPTGSHLKYVIFLTEGDCNVSGEIVFMEFGDPWAGFRFSLADGFNRDETTIIKSSDVTGKWHNFKLEAHWSRKENGYIRLMVNDIYVEEYKGQTLKCDQIQMTYGLLRAQIKKSNLVKSISNSVYFDNVKISNIDNSNPSIFLNAKLGKLNKKIQANNIHDGEYTFRLYVRFEGESDAEFIGRGLFEIKNGNIIFINKKQSQLKTGSTDLYDTLEGQIDEDGQFYGSIELDILGGKDRSEVYTLKGPINGKIWGDSPDECCARVYFLPRLKK